MQNFDQISEARLVERISRPINAKARLECIDSFSKRLEELHERL
jgi:hypothetical protein